MPSLGRIFDKNPVNLRRKISRGGVNAECPLEDLVSSSTPCPPYSPKQLNSPTNTNHLYLGQNSPSISKNRSKEQEENKEKYSDLLTGTELRAHYGALIIML